MVAQRDKTDKETQTKKRDKSRDKAKPGGRLPAYCGAPAAASRLTAGLPAGPGFSRSPEPKLYTWGGFTPLRWRLNMFMEMNRHAPVSGARLFGHEQTRSGLRSASFRT